MPELPTGTVTFLLTDVEGSTRLWEQDPVAMRAATARHDTLVDEIVAGNGGILIRPRGEGDSRFAVFARASDAVAAAAALQAALTAEAWPTPTPLRVRMALHTGEADLREGDYYGTAVNRCARLRVIAHGGQILVSQTTHDLVRSALLDGVGLRDLGEHRLADLTLPERVYQVVYPSLQAEFPPLKAPDSHPNNLPPQLTSFVGRATEIATAQRLLTEARLVTLTGAGGCGKTRLALQVAAEVLADYADGVWFVDLAPVSDPAMVVTAFAGALGLRENPERSLLSTLTEFLRARSTLLLVDNCEHLIEASAQTVEVLLRGAPRTRILATSRELLGVPGEGPFRVPSLAAPDPRGLPTGPAERIAALTKSEAVCLFAERARVVSPAFAVTERNASAVAQVCWRLDGMPLALELAAARVRVLAVEQIAARLDDRFRLLTGGSRTALRRQQTLAATLDWSYELLTDAERALLRRLAVFVGGWTLEAAEAVAEGAGGDVLDLLTSLVDKSLVVAEELAGETRYRLLETIRQYSGQKLVEVGEATTARERHLAWFLALAERAEPELFGRDGRLWRDRLQADYPNLAAAIEWSHEADLERGLLLVGSLWLYWFYQNVGEGHRRTEEMLALAAEPTILMGKGLLGESFYVRERGEWDRARAFAERSLELARTYGDRHLAGLALHSLGILRIRDPVSSRATLEESVALLLAVGDKAWAGATYRDLGHLAVHVGDYDRASQMYEASLALLRPIGEKSNVGMTLHGVGKLARRRGNPRQARVVFEEYLACGRESGVSLGIAEALIDLGQLDRAEGFLDRAEARVGDALTTLEAIRWPRGIATGIWTLATILIEKGEFERGVRAAGSVDSLELTRPHRTPADELAYVEALAAARVRLGDEAFERAWTEGKAMSLDQAVQYALTDEAR
jgi:predicted ATPase/class 3 adenylate cyclase